MKNKQNKYKLGYLLATFIFGTLGVINSFIDVPSEMIVLFRGLLGALTIYIILKISGGKLNKKEIRKNKLYIILSGVSLAFDWLFMFMAYSTTSVAITSLIQYTAPVVLVLFSPILFKKRVTLPKILCVLVSFAGVTMISGVLSGGIENVNFKGLMFAIISAFFFATFYVFNRKLTPELPNLDRSMLQLLIAGVTIAPFAIIKCLNVTFTFDLKTGLILMMLGIVHTGLAYILVFKSIKELPVQTISIIGYFEPVVGIILAAIFLGQGLDIFGIIGTVLILGASITNELI